MLLSLFRLSYAQDKAADPDAIDFSAKMDTILVTRLGEGPSGGVRTPDLSGDGFDDMLFVYSDQGPTGLRFGGPRIFEDEHKRYEDGAAILADVDGDGIDDMICPYSLWCGWHRGSITFPYFDSLANTKFSHAGFDQARPLAAWDVDGDGYKDIVGLIFGSWRVGIWKGGPQLDTAISEPIFDSLSIGQFHGFRFWAAGDVGSEGDHYVFAGSIDSGQSRIAVVRIANPLKPEDVQLLQDTRADGADGIAAFSIYVTDITGDGTPDVLVSDGNYIYIFKGGPDFGTYRLTKSHAYYRIPSPKVLYSEKWLDLTGFGSYMHAGGDLSGSGTPYLIVDGVMGFAQEWQFIYAGGKALDSLYDGVERVHAGATIQLDSLQRFGAQQHDAFLIRFWDLGNITDNDMVTVLYKDAERLPHKPNPRVSVSQARPVETTIEAYPSIADRATRVRLSGPDITHASLEVRNLLGDLIDRRSVWLSPSGETDFIDLSHYASGTYIVTVVPDALSATVRPISTRFIVHH